MKGVPVRILGQATLKCIFCVDIRITNKKLNKKGDYHSHFITKRQQSDNFGFK